MGNVNFGWAGLHFGTRHGMAWPGQDKPGNQHTVPKALGEDAEVNPREDKIWGYP